MDELDGCRIQFAESGKAALTAEGRVIFVGAVADAASGTLRVSIEVPNKTGRPAGEHVLVTFAGVGQQPPGRQP
jgi:hypothetical protein